MKIQLELRQIIVIMIVAQAIPLTTVCSANMSSILAGCSQSVGGEPWGCLLLPDGCNGTECNNFFLNGPGKSAEWSKMIIGRKLAAGSSTNTSQYVAIGFSNDTSMGDDYVIGCIYDPSSNMLHLQSSHNVGHDNKNIAADSTINLLESGQSDGLMWCTFERQLSPSVGESAFVFDLASPATYYLILANGEAESKFSIGFHSSIPMVSATPIDVGKSGWIGSWNKACGSISCKSQNRLIAAHGIMMLMAWWLFAPTAILLARYFKFVWPDTKIAGSLAWFQAHRFLNLLTVMFFLLALMFITVGLREWVGVPGDDACLHAICGLLAIILGIAQPIMAIFRCHPEEDRRYIFNWAHRIVGSLALLLATVAICSALMNFEIFRAEHSRNEMLGFVLLFTIGTIVFNLILGILEILSNRAQAKNIEREDTYDSTISSYSTSDAGKDGTQYILPTLAVLRSSLVQKSCSITEMGITTTPKYYTAMLHYTATIRPNSISSPGIICFDAIGYRVLVMCIHWILH